MALRMIRETCICETPMRSPISRCVRSSSKRSRSTSRSRSLSPRVRRASVAAASRAPNPGSSVPMRAPTDSPSSVSSVERAVERHGAVRPQRLVRLQHLLERDAELRGQLGGRRRPSEVGRQLVADATDADGELLQVARDPHRPAPVPEVALDLADDRRHGERRERGLARRVEAIDRLDQAERRHLDQVLERLAAVPVPTRQRMGERQEPHDELIPRGPVPFAVVAHEKTPHVGLRRAMTGRGWASGGFVRRHAVSLEPHGWAEPPPLRTSEAALRPSHPSRDRINRAPAAMSTTPRTQSDQPGEAVACGSVRRRPPGPRHPTIHAARRAAPRGSPTAAAVRARSRPGTSVAESHGGRWKPSRISAA